ncbi:MAG TPA: alpha/beta fold hydrolase [Longimicrobiales bacterium]|nr:alpha/beta fold hydrolase [Longimicrobiales bacterium]
MENIGRHTLKSVRALAALVVVSLAAAGPLYGQARQDGRAQPGRTVPMDPERAALLYVSNRPEDHDPNRDYQRDIEMKAATDSLYEVLTKGVVDYRKVTYRSRIGDMDIPAYVFQPLEKRGPRGHAAMIWVHGGVHGNWSIGMWPFVREAVERGYVIIAPEYRGSTGYGKEHHDAIDYGGYEIDDVLTAYDYLVKNYPHVDPERVGIMGWSHGGFITLHALIREGHPFKAGAAIVPVTNLIFRLSYKGPRYQRLFATQRRIQGLPFEKPELYVERSPVYHVDKIDVPVLVHVATNDDDVNFVEAEMLVHALRVKKPELAETKIYVDPPGGHSFSRLVNRETWEPQWTPELRDSWNRTWTFFEWNLRPYEDRSATSAAEAAGGAARGGR